jgi:UDP-3-O-[3-hydroxymyristoyl] glucosamine N-acyltransferase
MTVREIAAWLGGEALGPEALLAAEIDRVAKIEEAETGSLTFLSNPKYEKFLGLTRASAVLVGRATDPLALPRATPIAFIRVDDPYIGFLEVLKRLTPAVDPFPAGVDPRAVVASTARLGDGVALGPGVVIGAGAVIGSGTRIAAHAVVGPGAVIGDGCLLYPHVTVYHQCRIGHRVTLHAGCVIGSDGFGFAPKPDGTYEKIPQLGIVVIEDDVEIGANTTVDRATIGETRIEHGVKIDNLVQIAHNVVIGAHTVIAAQTGISGSVKIGRHCMIAGQVGIAGHLEIADRTTIMAQSGISKSITEPGKAYFGYPAREARFAMRIEAALKMLPETMRELQEVRRAVEELKAAGPGERST